MNSVICFGAWKGRLDMGLADRELSCLLGVAGGETDKQIAQREGLSPRTIKGAVERCMYKLGAYKRAELVAVAFKRGIIAPAACAALALLFGLQPANQPATVARRPDAQRRVELRVTTRRHECAWVA